METYLESAKQLLKRMQEKGEPIGKLEKEFVVQYAFYADSFEAVKALADMFSINGYEKEHGTLDRNAIWKYEREIMEKNQTISEFVSLTKQAGDILYEGLGLLDKMREFLKEKGLLVDYQRYLLDRELEERRIQSKLEKEKGARGTCQR